MRIGAHVSVGKGWVASLDYCEEVGAECLQVFSKSPRMWRAARLPEEAGSAFREEMRSRGLGPLFVHTSYLINLGSDDDELWQRSIDGLAEEMRRAGVVGATGLVTHLGTDPWGDRSVACERIADAIAAARERTDDAGRFVELLLENAAGTGRQYGADLAEIVAVADAVGERDCGPVGACFDTCHGFAYGYDLDTVESWDVIVRELSDTDGEQMIRLIHANDCLFARGERKDRHAWIGAGEIGQDGFASMMHVPLLRDVPVILEMPGEVPEKDEVNIERLKSLRDAGHS